ncbi:MAG: hypothetical protein HY903_06780 [Deltaproteobacteria bacterium]|nr:hypothetical protein [Deltaproteobacteria bacterium]
MMLLAACGAEGDHRDGAKLWGEDRGGLETGRAAQVGGSSQTITVRLGPNEPLDSVTLRDTLLFATPTGPTLEIAGETDAATGVVGRVVICRLTLKDVDAAELLAANVVVQTLTAIDVSLEDDPGIVVDPGTVVRCGRGGVATLSVGTASDVAPESLGLTGARANRIRLLGPPGGEGFVESVVVERSSVFGRIELRNVQVQDVQLESVTVVR